MIAMPVRASDRVALTPLTIIAVGPIEAPCISWVSGFAPKCAQ